MHVTKSMLLVVVVVLALIFGAAQTLAVSAQTEDICAHRTTVSFPHGSAQYAWFTSDAATVTTDAEEVTVATRSLIYTAADVTLSGVDAANIWSCYIDGPLSNSERAGLLNGLFVWDEGLGQYNTVSLVVVSSSGDIDVTVFTEPVPTPTATATLTPTPTATPTNTRTPTGAPTITPTKLQMAEPTKTTVPDPTATLPASNWRGYLALLFNTGGNPPVVPTSLPTATPIPTATATADVPFDMNGCGQFTTVTVTGEWPSAWTTTDAQILQVGGISSMLPAKAFIEAHADYKLATASNTWTCYFRGQMPQSFRDAKLSSMAPPVIWVVIHDDGTVWMSSATDTSPVSPEH